MDSKVGEGSRFSFLIPFALDGDAFSSGGGSQRSRTHSRNSRDEIDSLVNALAASNMPALAIDTPATLVSDIAPPLAKGNSDALQVVDESQTSSKRSRSKLTQVDAAVPTTLRILIVEVSAHL